MFFNGELIADTQRSKRILETSHPPTYYFPPEDVRLEFLVPTAHKSFCEWKGWVRYYSVVVGDRTATNAVWSYPQPTTAYAALQDYLCFYAEPMDACFVDDEQVQPQPGNFYGGWITSRIVGPFKGIPGSWGW